VRVPLLDLSRQYTRVRAEVDARVKAVFDSQQFILGRTVEEFEQAFRSYTGCAHAVGMSSGTDAQLAILMALGIGPGDAVITTPYSFFATAGCIHRVGAEPLFVDIRPDTFHMDAQKLRECLAGLRRGPDGTLLSSRGNRVRAVIPVHLFGSSCDMDALRDAVAPWALPIVEDAAQAIGTEYRWRDGSVAMAGNLSDYAFFSFFPTKNLGAAGDAGIAVCKDADFAARLRCVRNHGMEQRYFHRQVGGNFRLDALQAAVLLAKLPLLDEWNDARRRNAGLYREALGDLESHFHLPAEPWKETGLRGHHTFHQYVARAERRDDLIRHLEKEGVGHAIYYPVPLHRQECFADLGYPEASFPEAERAARESIALPIYSELREDEIAAVTTAIRAFYRS